MSNDLIDEGLRILRNRLPHFRLLGSVYFVTWRLNRAQPALRAEEREIVRAALLFFQGQRYRLYCYVVMDDHVHVLVLPYQGFQLSAIVSSWKSFTATRLRKEFDRGPEVWQKDYFDRIVRDEDELLEKANYMLNNPLKRWPGTREYPWAQWLGAG